MRDEIDDLQYGPGNPLLERISAYSYYNLRKRFWNKTGIHLPAGEKLFCDGLVHDELYVLWEPYRVSFVFEEFLYEFNFKPGFIFDKLSSPSIVRWLVDNDEPKAMIGGIVHDSLFALQLRPFRESNWVFYWLIKEVMLNLLDQYDGDYSTQSQVVDVCEERVDGVKSRKDVVTRSVYRNILKKSKRDLRSERKKLRKIRSMIRRLRIEISIKPKVYLLGVMSPFGRMIYNSKNPRTHWLKGFVEFKRKSIHDEKL